MLVAMGFALLIADTQGCATFNVDQGYDLKPTAATGILAVGFTFEGTDDNGSWRYRRIDLRDKGDINFWTHRDPIMWQQPYGRLAIVELAAGEYEFYDWMGSTVEAQTYFSIPFSVRPGRVTYLGRLHLSMDRDAGTYHVHPVDAYSLDEAIILARLARLTPDRIDRGETCIGPCRGSACTKPNLVPVFPLGMPRTTRLVAAQ